MAREKQENVSFADQLLNEIRRQSIQKNQTQARSKALASGYNRDILRLAELYKARQAEQEAVARLIMAQAGATFPQDDPRMGSNPDMMGGEGATTLQGGPGTDLMVQEQGRVPGGPTPTQGPTGPGRAVLNTPNIQGESVPRGPGPVTDVNAEEVRRLRGPNRSVGPVDTNASGRPNPVAQATPKPSVNPGLLMRLLGRAGPLLGAAGAMAPTEVAPGTYKPNEEAFRGLAVPDEEPTTMPPIHVTAPRGPVQRPSRGGGAPVLPERKPPVPGSEERMVEGGGMDLGNFRYVQMVVPVPADADEQQVAGFAEYIGAKDWGFRDDYVGNMEGHPAERR